MYVLIPRLVALNRTEFEKATEFEKTTAQLGAVREVSEERPRSVREASEARPGGVRGASGRRPRSVRELPERRPNCVPKACVAKPGPRINTSGDSVWSCLTFVRSELSNYHQFFSISWRCVFGGRHNEFPRFCTTTALVRKVENRRACAQELHRPLRKCAQNSSFEFESCVFAVPVQ